MNNAEILGELLGAHQRSYKRTYQKAKEPKAALIFEKDGELIEVYPHLEKENEEN